MTINEKKLEKLKTDRNIFVELAVVIFQQKAVTATVIGAIILGMSAFTYNNISLPKDSKRIDLIQRDVQEIKQYIGIDAVDKAITKTDIVVTKENVKEIKADINELKSDIKSLLGLVKKVNENTK